VNPKVLKLVEDIKVQDGVLPGILTLGKLDGEIYLVDGQHRAEAFLLSEMMTGYADVRICHFETMAEMSEEFITLNSALVRMRNDDIIRGLEALNPHVAAIRRRCPHIGYDGVRGTRARVLVSMASVLRTWFGSAGATPTTGPSSTDAVKMLDDGQVAQLCSFMTVCYEAWGNDKEHFRLWSSLNLAVLMWLWRRVVLGTGLPPYRGGTRVVTMKTDQFMRCMMSVAADPKYSEWLIGRALRERDRSPCYARVREIFGRRLALDGIKSARFPQEDWTKS
jgi:hypothetical protein